MRIGARPRASVDVKPDVERLAINGLVNGKQKQAHVCGLHAPQLRPRWVLVLQQICGYLRHLRHSAHSRVLHHLSALRKIDVAYILLQHVILLYRS